MLKNTAILLSSLLMVSERVYAQENEPAEMPKIVIDGKLDEYRAELDECLGEVDFTPFDIPKESRVMFDFETDYVQWMMEHVFLKIGKMTKEDEQYVRSALFFYSQRGYSRYGTSSKTYPTSARKLWNRKSHTFPTLMASMSFSSAKDNAKKMVRIKKDENYSNLSVVGKYYISKFTGNPTQRLEILVKILEDERVNTLEHREIIWYEVEQLYEVRVYNKSFGAIFGFDEKFNKLLKHPKLPIGIKDTLEARNLERKSSKLRSKKNFDDEPEEVKIAYLKGMQEAVNLLKKAWESDNKNIPAVRELLSENFALVVENPRQWLNRGLAIYADDSNLLENYAGLLKAHEESRTEKILGLAVAASLVDKKGSRLPEFAIYQLEYVNLLIKDDDIFENDVLAWLLLENGWNALYSKYIDDKHFYYRYEDLVKKVNKFGAFESFLTFRKAQDLKEAKELGVLDLVKKGRQLCDAGKYKEALTTYEKILNIWPDAQRHSYLYRDFAGKAYAHDQILSKPAMKWSIYSGVHSDVHHELISKPLIELEDGVKGGRQLEQLYVNTSYSYGSRLRAPFYRDSKLPRNRGLVFGLRETGEKDEPYSFIGCSIELLDNKKAKIHLTRNFKIIKSYDFQQVYMGKNVYLTGIVNNGKLSIKCSGITVFKDLAFDELKPIPNEKDVTKRYGATGKFTLPINGGIRLFVDQSEFIRAKKKSK